MLNICSDICFDFEGERVKKWKVKELTQRVVVAPLRVQNPQLQEDGKPLKRLVGCFGNYFGYVPLEAESLPATKGL